MTNIKSIKPFLAIVIVLTLICTVLSLSSQASFFTNDSIYTTYFSIAYIIALLVCLSSVFAYPKNTVAKSQNNLSGASKIFFAILGTLTILFGTLSYFLMSDNIFLEIIVLASCVGIYAFGGYLLSLSTMNGFAFSQFKLVLLLLSVGLPAAIHMTNNSDFNKPLNSPYNKLFAIFGAAYLIYIIYEGKHLHTGEHHRLHFASMLATIFTGFTASISYIVGFFLNQLDDTMKFTQAIAILIISIALLIECIIFSTKAQAHRKEEWNLIENPPEEIDETANQIIEETNEIIEA